MDKDTLVAEMSTNGSKYGNEYKNVAKELVKLYETIEGLCLSVKNANKSLVKSMVACYEAMLIKGHMGEEKIKYASVRDSFIKHSGKLNEARELAKILEKRLEKIKSQG
ncbi:MAG: hypothetical protein IJ400_04630 [Clostridia bacterium]|nr:hypothetical protein [Clostridia bacterium]